MINILRAKLDLFDPGLPLEQAHTIPSLWYFDSEIYAVECRAVFGSTWQVAGRAEQVAEPGSFLTTEIAGEPILVVRDGEGVLRAFFNVCRHRAACVMNEPSGKATRLRCRYHGWTYDLADQIQQEDILICEEVQRGLASRSFSTGRFSLRRESAGYHFHRLLARSLRAESD